MAILSKIRERSIALIAVIGLALFAFVLDPSTLTDFFNSTKINEVGQVAGETITRQDFAEALQVYQTQTGNRLSEMQAANAVWENLVRQKIYETQLEEAGITVGESDVWDELINSQSIKTNPQFFNEAGLFDENKLKQYLADIKVNDPNLYASWNAYINQIGQNLAKTTYDKLVSAGIGASLKEGEHQYITESAKMSANLIYVPFSTVPDSTITVSKKEIEDYVAAHPSQFKVEASKNLSFVKFNVVPTQEDETAIKNEVTSFLEDRKEYNNVTKSEIVLPGLKNAKDLVLFFDENKSDLELKETYQFKDEISKSVADQVFLGSKGDVFGPYKDQGYFKISKITDIASIPDSVKSSHILIPFVGALSAGPTTTKTEAAAKKSADSIYNLVRNNKTRFAKIADEINPDGTKGKGGDIGWITKTVGFSPNFDADFAAYMFNNKKGSVGVVKTKFGYHIIRVDDQKNIQKAVKLVSFGRKIEASEQTEATVFQNSEKFALELANGATIEDAAKANGYTVLPAIGIKKLDENVPGLNNQRQMVSWAFNKETKVGDYKRFDIEKGHVVAVVSGETQEGLKPASSAVNTVRPILVKEKKAAIIKERMVGANLAEIAKATNRSIQKMDNVAFGAPTISGVGSEPKILGAMFYAQENKMYNKVVGDNGVFAYVVEKKTEPVALPNYETYRKRLADTRKANTFSVYQAIKKSIDIEDNRAMYFGVSN